jgi:hypothetical protein
MCEPRIAEKPHRSRTFHWLAGLVTLRQIVVSGSSQGSRSASWNMLAVALISAALAGCGGGKAGEGTEHTAKTATATATRTPSPTPDRANGKRVAEVSQLKIEDCPSGWTQADRAGSSAADCAAISSARKARSARAVSPQFGSGQNTLAQSTVYLFPDDATAVQQFTGLASQATRACIADDLVKRLQAENAELQVGEPQTGRVAVDPFGDQRDGGRVTLPVTTEGQEVELHTDFVFVRVSRGIALMLFVDGLSPFDEHMRSNLTSKVSRRLASELG